MMTPTTELPFYKVVGAGNDFIIFFLGEPKVKTLFEDKENLMKSIRTLCDRVTGIGADGLIFLETLKAKDEFRWHFFNRDGSTAAMCGNAARAVTRLVLNLEASQKVRVLTQDAQFEGWAEEKNIVVEFQMPIEERKSSLNLADRKVVGLWIKAGVPHFVPDETVSWAQALARKAEMPGLRFAIEHGPAGANVTLVEATPLEEGKPTVPNYNAITFERGVEDFTLACGTGAIAAAWAKAGREGEGGRILIRMPGGLLEVQFLKDNCVRLIGEGRFVFQGLYQQEIL